MAHRETDLGQLRWYAKERTDLSAVACGDSGAHLVTGSQKMLGYDRTINADVHVSIFL
jgi:hypothetical protein